MSNPVETDNRESEHNEKNNKSSIILTAAIVLVIAAIFLYVPYRERKIKEEQIKDYLVKKYSFEKDKIIMVQYEGSDGFFFDYLFSLDSGYTSRKHTVKYNGVTIIVEEKSRGSVSSYEDDYKEYPVINDSGEEDE